MKVGDYVRTNKGCIAKIKKITELTIMCDGIIYPTKNYGFDKQLNKESLKRLQVKSSPNIIDLIEVGDYVNGYYVEDVRDVFDGEDTYTRICLASGCNYFQPDITEKEDIKTIVTKERFESVKYEIGD